jgi:hypothetical protein
VFTRFLHIFCVPIFFSLFLIRLQRLGRRQFGLKEDPAVPAKKPVTPTAVSVASAAIPAGPPGDSLSSIEIIRRTLQSRRRWVSDVFMVGWGNVR